MRLRGPRDGLLDELAASIKEEIVKMKRDDSAEKLLLGKLRQLGPAALNP